MIKLTPSCVQAQGVYKGRIENMVGGEEKIGCSSNNISSNGSSGNNSLSVLRAGTTPRASSVSPASGPLPQSKVRGGERPTTKMELDSGFSSRSPTPGNAEWKEGQSQGGDGVKTTNTEGIQKRAGLITSSVGEGRTKSNLQSGVEAKDKRTEKEENQKYQNQNVDWKSSSSYDNSRSYYDGGNSYSNHSSESGQYKKHYNQQYGYNNGYIHNQHQRRYNNNNNNNYRNNGNRTSKHWSKGGSGSSGSRSPNSGNGEWKESSDCSGSFKSSSSDVTLVNDEDSLVSLVECHNKLAIDAPGETKNGSNEGKTRGPEDKDDSRQYRQSNNNHSSGVGQYKRQSNQQYGNGYAFIRRYNNNNNYNYRNYGNNRRQFQNQNDYYHHQNHHYHNNQNGYYHRDGPNRGYAIHSPPFYNNYRRGNAQDLPSPDYEDTLPWPAKRGNWPNHNAANLSFSSNDKGYSTPRSRQCSPDTSPSSTTDSARSSSFIPGQNCEVSGIMINGNIINAQHLGPYDYICGNMTAQQAGSGYQYPGYHPNYYYNYPGTSTGHDSRGTHPVVPQTLGLVLTTDSNGTSTPSETGQGDKTLEWPEELSDETDSESVATSLSTSTRCHSPEDDFENLPMLTNVPSTRLYGESSPSSKESLSPNGTVCFRPVRRMSIPQIRFPPEWFEDFDPNDVVKQFSLAGEVKDKPRHLTQGSPLDSLSEAIWSKFVLNQQTTETFKKKVELWRDAYRVVRILNFAPDFKHDPRNFPTFGLQVVGSTMSGFGSNTSDVDMCLLIRASEVDQRFEAVDKLQTLCRTLKVLPCVENQELIYAKVPILKFRDANRRLEVDLNCNNFVGIRNTHLLYSYAQMDWRLKPLVLNVKLWAQYHRINDAKNMTISSYSLVLMVIHFLQYGVDEPVLPVLHKMYPEKFNNSVNILAVSIHETMPAWESRNTQSLAELLLQFFEYFGRKFDYTRNAVSVRLGGTVTLKGAASYRSSKNDPHQWKYLCVEEPFDRTNTARSVYDHDIFQKILGIFYASWQRLLVSRNLESIFTPISDEDVRAISMRVR